MKVLLTRPRADSLRIVEMLDEPGIDCLIWPMFEPRHLIPDDSVGAETDAIIFTSANAVPAFAAANPTRDVPAFCVGGRTAEAARAAGFTDCRAGAGDVLALIDLVVTSGARRLIYARGRDVSMDLKSVLREAGVKVTEQIVYEMADGPPPDSQICEALACGQVDIVTIWSARNAIRFEQALRQCKKVDLSKALLLAISEKSSNPLKDIDFRDRVVASEPSAEALIAAIREKNSALRQ